MEILFLRYAAVSLTISAVLMLLLLFLPWIRRRYTAKSCQLIWLLLSIRLLVPVDFSLPQAVVRVEVPTQQILLPTAQTEYPIFGGALMRTPVVQGKLDRTVSLIGVLSTLWLAGVAAFLLWHGSRYLRVRRRLLQKSGAASCEERAYLEELRREVGVQRKIELRRSEAVDCPLLLGLFHPVIFLPIEGLDHEERRTALRHELCHWKRRDLYSKALLLVCNAVHWFNPLVWTLARAGGHNLELCCDEDVLRNADSNQRRKYGEVLLHVAAESRQTVSLTTGFGSEARRLKGRLENLFLKKKRGATVVGCVFLLVIAMGALVAFQIPEKPQISISTDEHQKNNEAIWLLEALKKDPEDGVNDTSDNKTTKIETVCEPSQSTSNYMQEVNNLLELLKIGQRAAKEA